MRSTGRRRTCIDRGYKPICHIQQRNKHPSQRIVRNYFNSHYGHENDGISSPRNATWLSCPYVQGDEITAQAEVPIALDLSRGKDDKNLHLTLNLQLVPEGQMKKQVCKPKKPNNFLDWFPFGKKKPCVCKPNMETLLREMCTNLWAINSAIKDISNDQDSFIQNNCYVDPQNNCEMVCNISPGKDKSKMTAKPVIKDPCLKECGKKVNMNTERCTDKKSVQKKSTRYDSKCRSSSKSRSTSKSSTECEERCDKPEKSSSSDLIDKFHTHRDDPFIFSTSRVNIRKSDARKFDLKKLMAELTERPSLTLVETISDIDNWKNRNREHEIIFKPYRKYYCDEEKFAKAIRFKDGNQGLRNYKKGAECKNGDSDHNYHDVDVNKREALIPEKIRIKDSLHFDQFKLQGRKKIPKKKNLSDPKSRKTIEVKKGKHKAKEEPPDLYDDSDSNGSYVPSLNKNGKCKKENKRDSENKTSNEEGDSDSSSFSDKDKNKKWFKKRVGKSKVQRNFFMEDDFLFTKSYAADLLKRIEKRLEDE